MDSFKQLSLCRFSNEEKEHYICFSIIHMLNIVEQYPKLAKKTICLWKSPQIIDFKDPISGKASSKSKCWCWTCMGCSRCQNPAAPLPKRRWPKSESTAFSFWFTKLYISRVNCVVSRLYYFSRKQIPLWGWRADPPCPPLPAASQRRGSAWRSSPSRSGPAGSICQTQECDQIKVIQHSSITWMCIQVASMTLN